jgi:hypothetical protein
MSALQDLINSVRRGRQNTIGAHTVYSAQVDTWMVTDAQADLERLQARAEDADRLERRCASLAGSVVTTSHDRGRW